MNIESTNVTKTNTTSAISVLPAVSGAEEEEESTLVEISPSSSSSPTTVSSLSPSSRTSSTGTGCDDGGSNPETTDCYVTALETASDTKPATSAVLATSTDSSEIHLAALVEDLPSLQDNQQQQILLVPEVVPVVSHQPLEQSRNLLPIQSSSSLSTPSSSEEYDESAVTSNTEGALNVSSSNNQLNNNNTAIANTDPTVAVCLVESVLPPSSPVAMAAAVATSTPQRAPSNRECNEEDENHRKAPIEIVQIFPSSAAMLSSSATSSSSSSSSSSSTSSSSGTSSTSSTSSSPSVSPLAVDQQQVTATADSVGTTPVSAPGVVKTSAVVSAACERPLRGDTSQVSNLATDPKLEHSHSTKDVGQPKLQYHNRSSASSPQLHSSLKKYKMGERSSETRRRVSFPKEPQLITGYLEPLDPWASVTTVTTPELIEIYRKSCVKHFTEPIPAIIEHLQGLDLNLNQRVPLLSLKDQNLNHASCEALEEIFKRVQYRCINLSHAGLDDTSASVLFDMMEYYEATNELDTSDNLAMTNKSWLACINMIKKSQSLNVFVTSGPGISEHNIMNLAKALNTSALHTLKLEHCELKQRPLATLCNLLKRNTVLKELSLAYNELTCEDAVNVANLLRSNYHIQLLDISNNNIGDKGVEHIVSALIEQSIFFKTIQETKRRNEFSLSDLSSSLNNINSNKHYFQNQYDRSSQLYSYHNTPYHRQHRQQLLSKEPRLSDEGSPPAIMKPPTPPPSSQLLDSSNSTMTSMTPPSTPALPCTTQSDDVFIDESTEFINLTYQKTESPLPKKQYVSQEKLKAVLEQVVKSTNIDSGINSSVSSEIDQTSSDMRSNKAEKLLPSDISVEEKHLVMMATPVDVIKEQQPIEKSVIAPLMQTWDSVNSSSNENLVDSTCSIEKQQSNDSENDTGGGGKVLDGGGNVPEGAGENQTIELAFDLDNDEVAKVSKKARLAKQDSVLSEFESALLEPIKQIKVEIVKNVPKEDELMDEDTPEICADYDDDANLKILEENLLVDRSINTNSSEKIRCQVAKDPADDNSSQITETDNDDSAPVIPLVTHKKDELQLLMEKSQQKEELEQAKMIDSTPSAALPAAILKITEEKDSVETITSTSAPEKLQTVPLKIVQLHITDEPLSRSLDSAGSGEFESSFLTSGTQPSFPNERSFSSESLNSETSVDSNDSKSSLKIIESKFAARNGTLERQQSFANNKGDQQTESPPSPSGLQVLILWNNEITRNSAQSFSDLIENTSTLEILNVGCNLLCNDFVSGIKKSLKSNSSLTNLGLQGAHLSDNGAKVMAEVIEFGGNSTLQRIDLRNNNILATGLGYLNEALKSNKTVTRIDLDDLPRRVVDNSLGVGPEYARILNNIRAQCERNKHPQEPSEPISTSIKRVRSAHLNSRKISLTCTSIRPSPCATAGDKHHHHLLDPSKKTGGRLRSPLPSPIPSPVASPVPSPSRNRFQVTRVGESTGSTSSLTSINNSSTSPLPSSTGSSPTLFFAANSRFRVVTVEEPTPSSKSSSVVANNHQYSQGRMTSSSISPSPLVTGGISRIPPVSSCSAPALSSFVNSPKSTTSPISSSQSITTNTLSPVQVLLQQPQHLQTFHIPPPPITTPPAPPTPKPKHTRIPSTSSTLNDSVISSTSIESPDLEVKRFMSGAGGLHPNSAPTGTHSVTIDDSCCSSISSSIDSIDNVNFNNTSISSTDDSFDLMASSASSSSISVGSVSTAPLVKTSHSHQEDSTLVLQQQQLHQQQQEPPPQQQLNLSTKEAPTNATNAANLLKTKNHSLSSLEISTSSQESLYDVQDLSLSVSSTSGGSSSLVAGGTGKLPLPPPTSGNSNENTMTSIQSIEKDKPAGKPSEKPTRQRKTSWIASIGNHPKADSSTPTGSGVSIGSTPGSGYSPAIEKLLSIFSPSNLFSSSKSSPPNSECGSVPTGATVVGKENSPHSHPPSRKESPMGGLFPWSKTYKDEEKVLKVNVSPENTITPQHIHMYSHTSSQLPAYSVDSIPSQVKAEIKENISPENTITNKLLVNPAPSLPTNVSVSTAPQATHPKVIFRLGDDYDESEDDIDTLTNKYGGSGGGCSSDFGKVAPQTASSLLGSSAGSTTTNSSGISISSNIADGSPNTSSIMHTSHLGQLARDSLTTMFKNPSLTSQDSIRSMDSLTELVEPISQQLQSHQQQQQHQRQTSGDAQAQ